MASLTYDNIFNFPPGMDIYEKDPEPKKPESTVVTLFNIPQGPGSRFDADTVDGLQAVTAAKAAANRLVATGSDGLLPSSIIPTVTTTITNRAGTQTYQLFVEDDGALSVDRIS